MIRRRAGEAGFAALELSAGVALLVLPVVLLVAGLPQWVERQDVARGAARDAARVVALRGWCDRGAAQQRVEQAAVDGGLGAGALHVTLDCRDATPLARGGRVTARVSVAMPVLAIPMIGSTGSWGWTAEHREPVDPYGSRP